MITVDDVQRIRNYCFLNALEGVCQDNQRYSPCMLTTIRNLVLTAQEELDWNWNKNKGAFGDYLNSLSDIDLMYLLNEKIIPPGMERFHLIDIMQKRGLSLKGK